MQITIELPPEAEATLREEASAQGAKLEDFLSGLVRSWAKGNGLATMKPEPSREKSPQQRVADWLAFVASHDHITAVADDSRESIYEGRGE
jgi:hypothetical protein